MSPLVRPERDVGLESRLVASGTGNVEDYFRSLEGRIREDFLRIRRQVEDSGVKGHINEETLGEFIETYVPRVRVRYRREVFDHLGSRSSEMDICACNEFQFPGEKALLLAEGVDFVVQVKAVLTGDELKRILDNAVRLKSIVRAFDRVDQFYAANNSLIPHVVARIPYFVFAYESSLQLDTALSQWQSLLIERKVPAVAQPEAIFVLDRGVLLRFLPDGTIEGLDALKNPVWFKAAFDRGTLLAFVDTLLRFGRGIRHIQNPLGAYMQGSGITGTLQERGFGKTSAGDQINSLTWREIQAGYRVLIEAECSRPEIREEAFRRARCADSCVKGDFPAEAFTARAVDGTAVPINAEVLTEINFYLRHMVGKDPALSPSLRADVPFQFESTVVGKALEVVLCASFVADLQGWAEEHCGLFRQRRKS